jgi:hypothetical protein
MRMFLLIRLDDPLVLQRLFRRRSIRWIRLNERADESFRIDGNVLPVAVVAARGEKVSPRRGRRSEGEYEQLDLRFDAFFDQEVGFVCSEGDVAAE